MFFRIELQSMPGTTVGRLSAGGTDWGYACLADGEPVAYVGSGYDYYVKSMSHNSWYLNIGAGNAATWSFSPLDVILSSDKTLWIRGSSPTRRLGWPQSLDSDGNLSRWLYWVSEKDEFFKQHVVTVTKEFQ